MFECNTNIVKSQENFSRNILFRADSSSTIGTGHIMRDLVLAKREFNGDDVTFATRDLHGNINYKIKEAGYKIEILKSNDIDELNTLIKKLQIDLIIIDNYEIDYKYEKQLSILNPQLSIMVLDDTYEKHYCNILLNHNIYADEKRYRELVPKDCELRCGSRYTLLRGEFIKEKNIKRDKIYDMLLMMGGADTANLNIPILKTIPSNLQVVVITTTANKNLEKLKEYIKNKKNIKLFINSNEVAKLINQSKFAIITPSVSVNEIYYMGVDFLAIQTAENQKEMTKFFKKNDFFVIEKFNIYEFKNLIKEKY